MGAIGVLLLSLHDLLDIQSQNLRLLKYTFWYARKKVLLIILQNKVVSDLEVTNNKVKIGFSDADI